MSDSAARSPRSSQSSRDRRALRSAEVLFDAAVSWVASRGELPSVASLARETGLTRQTLYLHFPHVDELVLAAAVNLIRTGVPVEHSEPGVAFRLRSVAQHLEVNRDFYRTVLDGPLSMRVATVLDDYFVDGIRANVRTRWGANVSEVFVTDAAKFTVAGISAILRQWTIHESDQPVDSIVQRCEAVLERMGVRASP